MIEGDIGACSISKDEMVLTNTGTNNKENRQHRNNIPRSPKRQGGKPLTTIIGRTQNGRVPHAKNPYVDSSQEQKLSAEASLDDYRNRYQSLFRVSSEDSNDAPFEDLDELGRMMPGVLGDGIAYTVKETLIQGYIEKKGSGFDWLGSRAWKKRWAVLVKARTDGQNVDVPLLQIFWDYHSPTPSTVISLDSAVLLPENNMDPTKADNNHPYRFKIRHVKKSVNPDISLQLTRILGCSQESERDDWVYAINHALLNYEKEKASAQRLSSLSLSPPRGYSRSWANEDVMPLSNAGVKRFTPPSPPRIPCSLRK